MKEYKNKQDLLNEINKSYNNFKIEFVDVPENQFNTKLPEIDKTPQQMISYQIGWLKLLTEWDKQEREGKTVVTPHPDFKWNNLGGLYSLFYKQYEHLNKQQLLLEFNNVLTCFVDWVDKLSENELFLPEIRKWATTTAKWSLWKWIHINSVAPFTNFKTKIRKFKKLTLQNKSNTKQTQ